jgi:hypothetical protein
MRIFVLVCKSVLRDARRGKPDQDKFHDKALVLLDGFFDLDCQRKTGIV